QISELNNNGIVTLNKRLDKEILKLYQTLYYEGILEWREDPAAVVDYELEKGDLKHLSNGSNHLTLQSIESDESSDFSHATVLLKNKKLQAEIHLMSYWDSDGRVWAVKSYKKIE
ncbi:hypothetical protein KAJ89_05060, partial [Candidatus Parcubacteria bacterium]|nr:hypothetical protein [Candidatus Parcubacteria bacterium]